MYKEGDLTEAQADKIIGDKMLARINAINEWLSNNNYHVLLHSTTKDCVDGILSSEGLYYPSQWSVDTKNEILREANVSESELIKLENWVKSNKHNGKLGKKFETNPPAEKATITGRQYLSAKELLEYNHKDGDCTVVFCVPVIKGRKIGNQDYARVGFTQHSDMYLRREITGKYQKDGSVEFYSEYSYPQEGILFVYDRKNNRIRFNPAFNEEYYLDNSSPQLGSVQKGDLFAIIKEAIESLEKSNIGKRK